MKLKKRFIFLVLTSVCLPQISSAACSLSDFGSTQVASVTKLVGNVTRSTAATMAEVQVQANDGIRCNESVSTKGAAAKAILKLAGGGVILIHPNSSIALKPETSPDANVTLGDLKLQVQGSFEISINGHRAMIEAGSDGVVFQAGKTLNRVPGASAQSSQSKMLTLETTLGSPIVVRVDGPVQASASAPKFEGEILDSQRLVIQKLSPKNRDFIWRAEKPGRYFLQVYKISASGKEREALKRIRLNYNVPSETIVAGRGLASEPDRGQVAISEFQIEGGVWSAQSTLQKDKGDAQPNVGVVGLRWKRWYTKHAFELAFQTAALTAAPGQLTPTRLDLRYRRLIGKASLIAGADLYSSFGDANFKTRYGFFELGASYAQSFSKTWTVTPLATFGISGTKDFNYLLELPADYKLSAASSVGVGARIHLVNMGTYREGRSEPFAYFKWSY
ncbi:MAG: hypothetical protein EOP06_01745 [Proteobacteria bacterium]|nr:MAG: hypothetical protein EOP06_01745 [Pseudomonadota bacterium]